MNPGVSYPRQLMRRSLVAVIGVLFVALSVLLRLVWVPGAPGHVVINEVLASNGNALADEDGDFEDWIELYNPTPNPISLENYSLTDRPADTTKWMFSKISIPSGGRLLVWASGKNFIWLPQRDANDPLRLSFKSAGTHDGDYASIFVDGEDRSLNAPGMNVVRLNPLGEFVESKAFDTSNSALEVEAFFDYIASLPQGEIVILAVRGDAFTAMDAADFTMFRGWHSQYAQRLDPHDAWGMIRVVGRGIVAEDYVPLENGIAKAETRSSLALHTNFRLRQNGEFLGLYAPDGHAVDTVKLAQQTRNVSFGRRPDGAPKWCPFAPPTPKAVNGAYCLRVAAPPMASHDSGFYDYGLTVSFGNSRVTEIRVTLDGSEPTKSSPRYIDPIEIDETAVLRARAYRDGFIASDVVTYSYFVDEDVALPVVSLVTDPKNLWDEDIGIYVEGNDPNDANYEQHGMDWERLVQVEFFEADGSRGFAVPAGVRILGGTARAFPKKSLILYFREKYGLAELDYPVFPKMDVERFKNLVLRMGGDDGKYDLPRMRDAVMHALWAEEGGIVSARRPVFVYLNGDPWGIYNIRERMDADYLASHYGHDDVDLIRERDEIRNGDLSNWETTFAFFESHDLREADYYEQAQRLIDVENFTDYYLFQIYAGNIDLVEPNLIKYRPRTPGGKWRWIMWDVDVAFGLASVSPVSHNTLAWFTRDRARPDLGFYNDDGADTLWATLMLRKLLQVDEYRSYFINRFTDLLDTTLHPDHVIDLIDAFEAELNEDIEYDLDIWNHAWEGTYDIWLNEVERLREFARERPTYLRQYLMEQFRSF